MAWADSILWDVVWSQRHICARGAEGAGVESNVYHKADDGGSEHQIIEAEAELGDPIGNAYFSVWGSEFFHRIKNTPFVSAKLIKLYCNEMKKAIRVW